MDSERDSPAIESRPQRSLVRGARWLLRISPRTGSPGALAGAVAILSVALLVRLPMDALAETPLPPYITITPILPIVGFITGLRIGLAATAAAFGLAWYFWVPPFGSFAVPDYRTAFTLLIFMVAGPVALSFGALARHALAEVAANQATSERNAREAVHRTKNLLASVGAIVRVELKRTGDISDLTSRVEATLAAVARAQDILVTSQRASSSLSRLVEAGLATCAGNPALRIAGGPEIALPPGDHSGFILALHELCTNSVKYGALRGDEGRVIVAWTVADCCKLTWMETGIRIGTGDDSFGSHLIRSALSKIDGGAVSYQRLAGEIRCEFMWPRK